MKIKDWVDKLKEMYKVEIYIGAGLLDHGSTGGDTTITRNDSGWQGLDTISRSWHYYCTLLAANKILKRKYSDVPDPKIRFLGSYAEHGPSQEAMRRWLTQAVRWFDTWPTK